MDSILGLVQALPATDSWGPTVTTDTLRDGLPYAPFSKGDKLGRMADWTTEGKDREGRGGRQQYGRNFRGEGEDMKDLDFGRRLTRHRQTNPTAPAQDSKPLSTLRASARKPVSPLSTTRALPLAALSAVAVVPFSVDVAVPAVVLLSAVAVVALSSALEVADLDNSNTTTVAMHSVEAVVAAEEAGRTGTSRNAPVRLRFSLAIPGSCSRRLTLTVCSS
jgi:hypothetical protein